MESEQGLKEKEEEKMREKGWEERGPYDLGTLEWPSKRARFVPPR